MTFAHKVPPVPRLVACFAACCISVVGCTGSEVRRDAAADSTNGDPLDAHHDNDALNAPDATVALAFTVGTGAPGEFVSHEDARTLRLQRGCQGAQHIFTSIRVNNAVGERIIVGIRITRGSDARLVSVPLELRLPFDNVAPAGVHQITGLTPVIEDPADVLDQEVRVEVFVRDDSGAEAHGSMRGRVAWGNTAC